MSKRSKVFSAIVCWALLLGPTNLLMAQQTETGSDKPAIAPIRTDTPPYEEQLHRVAELVGSLHYLTGLCGDKDNNEFRQKMQDIVEAETANEPLRRKQLIAKYNIGYRAFASVYTNCTDAARLAEKNYRTEGKTVIEDLLARYSN
jgi:uncharacterized protein (TIGR02301 family)